GMTVKFSQNQEGLCPKSIEQVTRCSDRIVDILSLKGTRMFIGQTRFSLFMPGSSAWRASDNTRFRSESEYLEYLYSEERLEARAKLFFDFSLPQLADAARGYDVTHLVSYSDSLPAKYQRQLEEAAAGYDFLQLDR